MVSILRREGTHDRRIHLDVQENDDLINNSSTLKDTELFFNAKPNTRYLLECKFHFYSNATANFKIGMSTPSGTTGEMANYVYAGNQPTSISSALLYAGHSTNDFVGSMFASIKTGSVSGAVTIQFAQFISDASDTDFFEGSTLQVWEVGSA